MDICSIARFRAMSERRPAAAAKILTASELALESASQAARFAAKEALAKALGGPSGMRWHDVEVVKTATGQPRFALVGTVLAQVKQRGITSIHLSISHDAEIASAMVVCEQ